GRELGPRIGLVPSGRLAVVADELLVEAVLRAAGLVRLARPEARRVRRQRLVAEDEVAVRVEPELELRVRDDDPGRPGVLRRGGVQADRDLLDLAQPRFSDELGGLVAGDVLVVAGLGLRRGREDRLRQLLGLAQPGRQRVARRRAGRLVILPARAGEVSAHDALDREHLEL